MGAGIAERGRLIEREMQSRDRWLNGEKGVQRDSKPRSGIKSRMMEIFPSTK